MEKRTEHGEYLAPYHSLISSYKKYIFRLNVDLDSRCKYWVKVKGKKEYRLPLVGLQQLCDKEPFHPTPKFNRPPERSFKLHNDSSLLPLSSSGLSKKFSLYKGSEMGCFGWESSSFLFVGYDLSAWQRFCEVRKQQLLKIIEQLEKPLEMRSSTQKEPYRKKPRMG